MYGDENFKNIHKIAEKFKQQDQKREARQIMNSYRQVQDFQSKNIKKYAHPSKKNKNTQIKEGKSTYATKIQATLKEINASRKKELQKMETVQSQPINKFQNKNQQQQKLRTKAIKQMITSINKEIRKSQQEFFFHLQSIQNRQINSKIIKADNWRAQKFFLLWKDQCILLKIQRQKQQQNFKDKLKIKYQISEQYYRFRRLKLTMKGWNQWCKRQIKKKLFQKQKKKEELQIYLKEQNRNNANYEQQNTQLQNKLKEFLQCLKDNIDTKQNIKNRLKTIKQKTEESELVKPIDQESYLQNQNQNQKMQTQNDQYNEVQQEQKNQQQIHKRKKQLTNEQLEKRRKQLQKKSENRKQILLKFKKQKELRKKQAQKQLKQIQDEIQEKKKKNRQKQYRQFMKKKKEKEEEQKKEQKLKQNAFLFNKFRLLNNYGWKPWRSLKIIQFKNTQYLATKIRSIMEKYAFKQLLNSMQDIANKHLQNQFVQKRKIYNRKLMKKCLKIFQDQKNQQLVLKQQLSIRHEVFTLKICLNQWMKILSRLRLQNFQWQRPRIKKAQSLKCLSLQYKAFRILLQNRNQEQKNRIIDQHKKNIQNKIQGILTSKCVIKYDQLL